MWASALSSKKRKATLVEQVAGGPGGPTTPESMKWAWELFWIVLMAMAVVTLVWLLPGPGW